MLPLRLESLAEVFAQVPDPRKPRGIRHPVQGMLALVFLGLLARIREMAVLQRWAETHWDEDGQCRGSVSDNLIPSARRVAAQPLDHKS